MPYISVDAGGALNPVGQSDRSLFYGGLRRPVAKPTHKFDQRTVPVIEPS